MCHCSTLYAGRFDLNIKDPDKGGVCGGSTACPKSRNRKEGAICTISSVSTTSLLASLGATSDNERLPPIASAVVDLRHETRANQKLRGRTARQT